MSVDVDKLIYEAEEEIEKLKTLKAKRGELDQLRMEINADSGDKAKVKKVKRQLSIPRMTPCLRKVVATLVVLSVFAASFLLVSNIATAVDPAIGYASPDDSSLFADQSNGDGVNWTINVTDADTNLAWVKLYSNDSGSWALFYDSGALGGVAYHNASGQNGNWTGSWTTYYWNISANDGTTHDTVYSFTTKYQWGDPQMAVLDDVVAYDTGIAYKNATNDYYFWYENGQIDVKTSTTGTNWSLEPKSADIGTGSYLYNAFTYDNNPSVLYYNVGKVYRAYWDGASWNTEDTGRAQSADSTYAYGGDAIYYDGVWNIVVGYSHNAGGRHIHTRHMTGTFPNTWSLVQEYETANGPGMREFYISLAVLNGTMHFVYKDTGYDLHWRTYNGVAWTDRGDIELDIDTGCSMVKDPLNRQLVCVYVNGTGDLVYRTTDNLTAWSDSHLILSKGSYTIQKPHAEFMDSRLVVTFSYNLRGNYNIYTMSAPDYSGRISGFNYTLNRVQWPDTAPDDTRVNSTVFSLKNIDNRSIATIMWHFEDIGEITAANNFKIWTNMSGAWSDIGTCDASGNVTTLDISGEMAGAGEWVPGQKTYWKIEILAIGSVSEDLHTVDEEIYYKITFA